MLVDPLDLVSYHLKIKQPEKIYINGILEKEKKLNKNIARIKFVNMNITVNKSPAVDAHKKYLTIDTLK